MNELYTGQVPKRVKRGKRGWKEGGKSVERVLKRNKSIMSVKKNPFESDTDIMLCGHVSRNYYDSKILMIDLAWHFAGTQVHEDWRM